MKKLVLLMLIVAIAAVAGMVFAQGNGSGAQRGFGTLIDTDGNEMGFFRLTQFGNGPVEVYVEADGITGSRGIHFHTVGVCDPATAFESAGPHFNPSNRRHGLNNPSGPHDGDLPNIQPGSDGYAIYSTTTDLISLGSGPANVFDGDGTSLIIHVNNDDQVTDPAGNSGARVLCGVVENGGQFGFFGDEEFINFTASLNQPTNASFYDAGFFEGFNTFEIDLGRDCNLVRVYKLSPEGVLDLWQSGCVDDDTLTFTSEGDGTYLFASFNTPEQATQAVARITRARATATPGGSSIRPTQQATTAAPAAVATEEAAAPAATEAVSG